LGSPRQTFGGKLLYPTLEKQASILFYSLIKNHPFENGNKRIAVMALLTFLSLNNKWLLIHPDDLYDIAIMVSKSQSEDKDKILDKLERILKEKVTNADF
jgi:death-on-curing family protein